MEKNLEYYKIMITNETALSLESIEDIRKAAKWLIREIEKVNSDNQELKNMLSATQKDIQFIRDNVSKVNGAIDDTLHNYFERVWTFEGARSE